MCAGLEDRLGQSKRVA